MVQPVSVAMEDEGLRADRQLDRRIGETLRTLRQARGMSLQALGDGIGVSYQQLQKYERGANRISASTLYRLAQILQCDVGTFFKGIAASGTAKQGLQTHRENLDAARALDRIEDPVVRDVLRDLIVLLDGTPKLG